MRFISLPKHGLLVYEVSRVLAIAMLLSAQTSDSSIFINMIFAIQGVLFPLMALFICIDSVRYKEYLPLFISGKAIGIVLMLGFSFFSNHNDLSITANTSLIRGMTFIILDLFSLALILLIKKDVDVTSAETSNKLIQTEPETEET